MEDDGTFNILELKSGKWSDSMRSKIRKELTFYYLLLDGKESKFSIPSKAEYEDKVSHISWFYPRFDVFESELIKKRSITAVYDQIEKMIEAYKDNEFKVEYYYKKCESCFLNEECLLL